VADARQCCNFTVCYVWQNQQLLAATLCGSWPGVQSASPKTPKNTHFLGSPSPQGSHSPYILGDTTRPRHVTYAQVSSKSDQRRLRKTLHKQTDKPTDTTKIMATWPWTNKILLEQCVLIPFPTRKVQKLAQWDLYIVMNSCSYTKQMKWQKSDTQHFPKVFFLFYWHCVAKN